MTGPGPARVWQGQQEAEEKGQGLGIAARRVPAASQGSHLQCFRGLWCHAGNQSDHAFPFVRPRSRDGSP
jgi:hypothetical protein